MRICGRSRSSLNFKQVGNNHTAFQNFCENILKALVPVRVCNTHVSSIPAENGTFKKLSGVVPQGLQLLGRWSQVAR